MAKRGATRFSNYGAFAGHRTSGGGKFLSKWKENGTLNTWMHTKELPIALWRHSIPNLVTVEDKRTRDKTVRVFSKSLVCHERIEVLEQQHFKDRDTGEWKAPPERCSICKLVKWAYTQAVLFEETRESKKPKGLSFTTPIFKFEGDDSDETKIVHIGGLTNLFSKDLNDRQKDDLKKAKVKLSEAWAENMWAKCQYALCVVDNDDPASGVQIAVEASSLGQRVQKVINDMLKDDRDYVRDPYCIEWEYLKNETDLNKKYDARALTKIKLTPRIRDLIFGEAPDLTSLTEPFNQQTIRATLERHCLIKDQVPWDDIFPSPEQEKKWREEDEAEGDEEEEQEPSHSRSRSRDDEEGDEEEGDEDEEVECDNCNKGMPASASVCPHCKHEYDVSKEEEDEEPEPEPEPEKPKMRSRSEAMASKKAASNGAAKSEKKKTTSKPKKEEPEDEEESPDSDGIPF